jgi:hypothetical protein
MAYTATQAGGKAHLKSQSQEGCYVMETSHHFPAFREATGRHVRSASWYFPFAGLTLEASVVDWVVD